MDPFEFLTDLALFIAHPKRTPKEKRREFILGIGLFLAIVVACLALAFWPR